nr:proline racemase family protein [Mesorhizobium sp.]
MRELVDLGCRVQRAIDTQLDVRHPEIAGLSGLSYTMFVGYDDGRMKGVTVVPPGWVDRSPCLAVMYARGQFEEGEKRIARSIIDSEFEVSIIGTTKVAGKPGILPRISGRGWIRGIHQIGVDPTDPYQLGYMVSDCWGDAFGLLE